MTVMVVSHAMAQNYPITSKTLKNGLQVIVCEKPGNDFVEVEVWYRVGSKDEKPGIRGMAHMFEHMMFRGTKKFPGDFFDQADRKYGWRSNAYTSYDRTVYHEYVPSNTLELAFDIESDRMANLVVTQEILNTERQVVGEELRNGSNNWYGKLQEERYPLFYPKGHPYEVDVIGFLPEIVNFTTAQCMDFYNNFYSPNNAYVVVVGNVKSAEVFALAEKYFAPITKQLSLKKREDVPSLDTFKLKMTEMSIFFPVQIYTYIVPKPASTDKDFYAFHLLNDLLFSNDNSILANRIVKKDYIAYGINAGGDLWSMYPNMMAIDIIMDAQPGNVRVKRAVKEEINKVISDGVPPEMLQKHIAATRASNLISKYGSSNIAAELGVAQYYFNDYTKAFTLADEYAKISQEDIRRVAAKYFSEDKMQLINIKPE